MLNPELHPVHWPAAPGVRAAMTGRAGGASHPPFDSFNLGDHVGDDPLAVAANRAALAHALGAHPVFLQQVHGTHAEHLHAHTPHGTVADACVTTEPGVVCTVMVADCLPVLLADGQGRTVAAAHAGWRGLAGPGLAGAGNGGAGDGCNGGGSGAGAGSDEAGDAAHGHAGVLESVFELFRSLSLAGKAKSATEIVGVGACVGEVTQSTATAPGAHDSAAWARSCVAWLGPCIGPSAFEVGVEVRDAFVAAGMSPEAVDRCFAPVPGHADKLLANLVALARLRLQRLGLEQIHGNDGSAAWCTVAQDSVWFSHRRDTARLGGTGRMAACVWLDGGAGGGS